MTTTTAQSAAATATRVLHLEDNPYDAELIQGVLTSACPDCAILWARNGDEYRDAVAGAPFDLIVCDYNLPDYDGLLALEAAREHQPGVPVIMVSGTLSEDEAVDCIKAGAVDYVLKGRLQRLPPAIVRALREAREHRERVRAEAALRLSEERLQLALEASAISVWEYDIGSGAVTFSRQLGPLLGYRPEEVPGRIDAWEALTHPEDVKKLREALAQHYSGETPSVEVEYRVRAREGGWRWLRTTGRTVQRNDEGRPVRMAGTHTDITERRRFDEMLRLQERALEAATHAIVIVDARAPDYPIVHVNQAFERITGYSAAQVDGRNCRFLQGADRGQPELERLREAVVVGREASALLRNYRKDGSLFWNNVRVSPVRNAAGIVTHFVGVLSDMTELKQYQIELELHANYDTLTGLVNRNLLADRLDHGIAAAQRARRGLGVLCMELDRSHLVDEGLHRASGEALVKAVGARLRQVVRESDTVARVEGDEFAVILYDLAESSAAAPMARKILGALEQPIAIEGHDIVACVSIGVALYPQDGRKHDELMGNAHAAMRRAKQAGRNQIDVTPKGVSS